VAVGLFAPATARAAAVVALALLAVFCIAILRALSVGATPDCNCFGGLTQTEVGRGTLVRDVLLGGLAGFAVFGAPDQQIGALHWIGEAAPGDRPSIVILACAVAILGAFCWVLLRQNGRLLLRLEAVAAEHAVEPPLEPGSPAPDFGGLDLDGEPISLQSLLGHGLPVALFFTDPDCGACGQALELVASIQREQPHELTLAVVSRGDSERMRVRSAELGIERVFPQNGDDLFDAYRVHGVPGAVMIDPDGRIARRPVLGADAAREMLGEAFEAPVLVHAGGGSDG
jgi:peroxiredoxin